MYKLTAQTYGFKYYIIIRQMRKQQGSKKIPIDQSRLIQLIKWQEQSNKNQLLASLRSVGHVKSNPMAQCGQPQQLQSYREYFYGNALFAKPQGQAQLKQIMRSMHPTLRFDSRIPNVLKDFGKMYLQELLQQTVQMMGRTGNPRLDSDAIQEANWTVSKKLWRNNE